MVNLPVDALITKIVNYFFKKNLSFKIRNLMMRCYYEDIRERLVWDFNIRYMAESNSFDLFYLLVKYIQDNAVLFFLKFHKINKHIRKYSRGKSGRYTAKIAYIAPKSRFKLTLKLIVNEFKSSPTKSIELKILRLCQVLVGGDTLLNFSLFRNYISRVVLYKRLYI